jgi:hypothetical protein
VTLKTCHIYPVSAGSAYHWKWRCIDGKKKSASARAFELFYECVEDARSHGGEVDLEHVHREIANAYAVPKMTPPSPRP